MGEYQFATHTFTARNGAHAWQLAIDDFQAELTSGALRSVLLLAFPVPVIFLF